MTYRDLKHGSHSTLYSSLPLLVWLCLMDYGSEYGSIYDYGLLLWVIVLGNLVMGNVVMRYGHFDWIQIGFVLWSDFSSVLKISNIHVLLLSHTKKEFLVIIIWISQDLDPSRFGFLKYFSRP